MNCKFLSQGEIEGQNGLNSFLFQTFYQSHKVSLNLRAAGLSACPCFAERGWQDADLCDPLHFWVLEKAAEGKKSEFLCKREVLGIVPRKGFAAILLPVAQIILFIPVVRATEPPRLWISKDTFHYGPWWVFVLDIGKIFGSNAPSAFVYNLIHCVLGFSSVTPKAKERKKCTPWGSRTSPSRGSPASRLTPSTPNLPTSRRKVRLVQGLQRLPQAHPWRAAFFVTAARKITFKTESPKSAVLSFGGSSSSIFWPGELSGSPGSRDPTERVKKGYESALWAKREENSLEDPVYWFKSHKNPKYGHKL